MTTINECFQFLEDKGYDIIEIKHLHSSVEEFDFDHWQEYHIFISAPNQKDHAKILILRRNHHLGISENLSMESRKLIKVI